MLHYSLYNPKEKEPYHMSEALTPAEEIFTHEFMDNGLSLEEASYLAWPTIKEPILRAQALIKNNDFVRARFHTYLDLHQLSDEDIAKNLALATQLALDDPKSSTALLNATKEAARLKDLYAPPPQQKSLRDELGIGTGDTQINIVQQFIERAKDAGFSEEDIDSMVEAEIIDVKTIPKEDLFSE